MTVVIRSIFLTVVPTTMTIHHAIGHLAAVVSKVKILMTTMIVRSVSAAKAMMVVKLMLPSVRRDQYIPPLKRKHETEIEIVIMVV